MKYKCAATDDLSYALCVKWSFFLLTGCSTTERVCENVNPCAVHSNPSPSGSTCAPPLTPPHSRPWLPQLSAYHQSQLWHTHNKGQNFSERGVSQNPHVINSMNQRISFCSSNYPDFRSSLLHDFLDKKKFSWKLLLYKNLGKDM